MGMHMVLSSVPSSVGGSCFARPTAPGARSRYHRLVWTCLGGTKRSRIGWGDLHGTMRSGAGERVQPIPKPEHETNTRRTTFIPLRALLIYLFSHRRCDRTGRPGPTRVPQQAGSRSPGGPHSGAGTPGTRPLIRVGAMRAQGRREGLGPGP